MENNLKQISIEVTDRKCRESFPQQRKEVLMSILDQIGDSIILDSDDSQNTGIKLEDISWRLIYNYEIEASSTKVTLFNDKHIIIEHDDMKFTLQAVFIAKKKIYDPKTFDVIGHENVGVEYFDSISSVSLKPKDSAREVSSRIINERF